MKRTVVCIDRARGMELVKTLIPYSVSLSCDPLYTTVWVLRILLLYGLLETIVISLILRLFCFCFFFLRPQIVSSHSPSLQTIILLLLLLYNV